MFIKKLGEFSPVSMTDFRISTSKIKLDRPNAKNCRDRDNQPQKQATKKEAITASTANAKS
jgi:hypothetical protein